MSTLKEPQVAIIGLGNIGHTLAVNLTKGNRSVLVATRDKAKAEQVAQELGSLAQAREIPAAIAEADILILAIWFNDIKAFFTTYASALEGKIIIDPSNPIAPDEKGGFVKTIGENESAGQILAGLVPNGAQLVKAFGTLGAASLASASGQKPEPAVLFYATNDESVNGVIEELIVDAGFDPFRVGDLNQSIRIEVFGDLHEFGALGKPVTLPEAQASL